MPTTGARPKRTILITGFNGYLAGRTAELVLRAGYRVRGTVRNKLAGKKTKAALCRLGFHSDDIDVVHVADMCLHDSFDSAADGIARLLYLTDL
jgi:uncharacterized protein YbjT (DUF2867 family)